MTFEAWVKPEAATNQGLFQNMQHSKNGFRVNLNDLKVQFCLQSGTHEAWLSSKRELPEGEWSHFACTYDGKMARIYVNGVLDVEMEFGSSAHKLVAAFSTVHSMDLTVPVKCAGRTVTLHLRTVAKPDPDVALLLSHLGLHLPKGSKLIQNVVEKIA